MALPGTKVILGLLNRLVLKSTHIGSELKPKTFRKLKWRFAGDDVIGITTRELALNFVKNTK
jgi:hypothetical protein